MVTCQSSELGWEVTVELPDDFLSLGRGSVKLISEQGLGDSLPIFRSFSTVFLIELFIYNDFPIATYIVLLILACIKYCKVSVNILIMKFTALCLDEVVEVSLGLPHQRPHQRDMSSTPLDQKMLL